MVRKKGTNVPPAEYGAAIAVALREELGGSTRAVKTIVRWTGASDRAAKYWLAGERCPNGRQLIILARHSDAVLKTFLALAGRDLFTFSVELTSAENALARAAKIIAELKQPLGKN
jgi:hypothetical protein